MTVHFIKNLTNIEPVYVILKTRTLEFIRSSFLVVQTLRSLHKKYDTMSQI